MKQVELNKRLKNIALKFRSFTSTATNQQYYSKQQTRYYNNNNPTNIIASNKPDITSKYQAQPESRAHFSTIYQSRPMAKYQSQPTKVSSIIENHRLRSDEPKSTQTPGYNYRTTTTRQQASNATNKQAS
jgi:hypothetical protein